MPRTDERSASPSAGGSPPGVVFTDLDGTLLDHATYDFTAALPALRAAERVGVILVLCSSKTRTEMLAVQERLGVRGPCIPENGGAVLLVGGGPLAARFPDRVDGLPAKVFGTAYPELRAVLETLRRRFGCRVTGFGDVDEQTVASWTGLPLERARLARQRDFDEPFLWEPEPEPGLRAAVETWLAARDLRLTRGGRFWHLMGASDKGRAVRWLLDAMAARWGLAPPSLALGDSENDLPMLAEAGRGVLVERPGGGHLEPRPAGIGTVSGIGPAGWARAVFDWLQDSGIR